MPRTTDETRTRNLSNALRQQHSAIATKSKAPAPTDQDILWAMLGKPWKTAEERSTGNQRKAS